MHWDQTRNNPTDPIKYFFKGAVSFIRAFVRFRQANCVSAKLLNQILPFGVKHLRNLFDLAIKRQPLNWDKPFL